MLFPPPHTHTHQKKKAGPPLCYSFEFNFNFWNTTVPPLHLFLFLEQGVYCFYEFIAGFLSMFSISVFNDRAFSRWMNYLNSPAQLTGNFLKNFLFIGCEMNCRNGRNRQACHICFYLSAESHSSVADRVINLLPYFVLWLLRWAEGLKGSSDCVEG